jgi:hypothetical protein
MDPSGLVYSTVTRFRLLESENREEPLLDIEQVFLAP